MEQRIEREFNNVMSIEEQRSIRASKNVVKYEVWSANLNFITGNNSIQKGIRPVIIISCKKSLTYSPTVTVVPVTSLNGKKKKELQTHVEIGYEAGLNSPSMILCEQLITIDKLYLISKIGKCSKETIKLIRKSVDIQLGREEDDNEEELIDKPTINKTFKSPYENMFQHEDEVFDLYKVRTIADNIKEAEDYIIEHKLFDSKFLNDSIALYINELKMYCDKFNQDCSIFYKPIKYINYNEDGGISYAR